jgi:hypothetical protein
MECFDEPRKGEIFISQPGGANFLLNNTDKKTVDRTMQPTVQFGVILRQPAAGQAKEKFFSVRTFQGAAGDTE